MHADTQQLIALLDGEPAGETTRRHVASCADCQRELEFIQRTRSRLVALPAVTPPPPAQRVLAAGIAPARGSRPLVYLALAASLVVVATMAAWLAPRDSSPPTVAERATPTSPDRATPPQTSGTATRAAPEQRLQVRSAALEREWRALRQHTGAVRRIGFEAGTQRLKARLLALDAEHLVAPAGATRPGGDDYWNRRVRLLDSLVDIERAELLTRGDGDYQVVRASAPARQPLR